MGDEQPDEPAAAALIDDAVRGQLAAQMERLNDNLEKQFLLIEDQRQADERQRAKDRVSARRRWYIVMLVVLLIGLGNVRVEQVRREGDRRDKASAAAQAKGDTATERATELATCRRTNLSRAEIRGAFDQQGDALVSIANAGQKAVAAKLVQDTHDRLAATLKSKQCTEDSPAEYQTCAEAVADGAAPLARGQRGYRAELDADGDGVACE